MSGGLVRRRRLAAGRRKRRDALAPAPPPPRLEIADRQRAVRLPASRIRRAVAAAIVLSKRRAGPLSIALVDDRTIRRLHREHLGLDSATDVLSFPLGPDGRGLFGEVVASGDTAKREARERGLAAADELLLYVVHGVLHLLGFDDHGAAARKKMRAAERAALRAAGIRRDLFPSRERGATAV